MGSKPHPVKAIFFPASTGRFFDGEIARQVRARLASTWVENDTTFAVASRGWNLTQRDRYDSDRETILTDSLEAWRLNPLARRIVGLDHSIRGGRGHLGRLQARSDPQVPDGVLEPSL